MKSFIFATVSSVALLLAYEARAEDAATPPAAPEAPAMKSEAAPAPMHHAAPAHKKAAAAHHHKHRHHHGHHHHKHHAMGNYNAEIGGIFVTFPPFDECGRPVCTPAYYAGNPECPYQYHGGYFWYPHARGNLLQGYAPYHFQGRYWYASRMHPHMVYADRTPLVYTYPYPLHHPMDGRVYAVQPAPMQQKWESAPSMQPAQD